MRKDIDKNKVAFNLCRVVCDYDRDLCVAHPKNCNRDIIKALYNDELLEYLIEETEYFDYHNKNLTNIQYQKISKIKEILKCIKKSMEE